MGLYLIFGIIGLRTLGGKFWSCNDASVTYRWQCVGTYLNEARCHVPVGPRLYAWKTTP